MDNKKITILSYNLETILAEKIQSILDKQLTNTRMRDFYDVYIINKLKWADIDNNTLKKALHNTIKNRNTLDALINANEKLDKIADDRELNELWERFLFSNEYIGDVKFIATIKVIKDIFGEIL
jgi:predicted nucleotidyltransferase component of viral defense system